MFKSEIKTWVRICIFNLMIVAVLGSLMRFKIAFEFPFFVQKNLLHSHSHFALFGWISFILMILIANNLGDTISEKVTKQFRIIFIGSIICAYGMLISFALQGYGLFSIFFSTLSILLSFTFGGLYYKTTRSLENTVSRKWFLAAIVFNIISAVGICYLSYMMASKNYDQHLYLASVYWYLHFQYNGWFLFAVVGLIIHHLEIAKIYIKHEKIIFRTLAISCVPTYGLSVLWLDLPIWIFLLVIIGTTLQLLGSYRLVSGIISKKIISNLKLNLTTKILFGISGMAFSLKILLQTFSTVPAISKLAFGFRPIVIAYLHLVLLGLFTLFILGFLITEGYIRYSKLLKVSVLTFVFGVFLNEILLAFQGILSFGYVIIPYDNELLLLAAIIMFSSMLMVFISQVVKRQSV